MKSIFKVMALGGLISLSGILLQSCSVEDPFDSADGSLRVKMLIDTDVTRAAADEASLSESCVLYISGSRGLVRKYKGLGNIPELIPLNGGQYLAEAWAGDSVPASFDKKFYQGSQSFTIAGGQTDVSLRCGIANVVASVDAERVAAIEMSDYKVTVGHSQGSLDFTAANIEAKGYFMMPNADKDLSYTVSGKDGDGKDFSVSGVIPGVKKGHEYIIKLSYNPTYEEVGGAFVNIEIDDREILVESEVVLLGRPVFKGIDFDIDKQIFSQNIGGFASDAIVQVKAFGGIKQLMLESETYSVLGLPASGIDLLNLSESVKAQLNNAGIDWEVLPAGGKDYVTGYITFGRTWLNSLNDGAYTLTVTAHDAYGKYTARNLRIGVGEGNQIIDDPVLLDQAGVANLLDVRSYSASITGQIVTPDPVPSLQYRVAGTTEWSALMLNASASRRRNAPARAAAEKFRVNLSNLTPGTRYEYRAVAGDFATAIYTFTTESLFAIPNSSFEEWSSYSENSKVTLPASGGTRSFWDSGNHGSATMNVNLTQGSSDMIGSGSLSAKMRSQFVGIGTIGKFAAGNLFAGEYVRTDGMDGVLSFGREYNGSHPKAVRFKANYRPGTVEKKGAVSGYLSQGDTDHAQVYVALSTEKIEIRTKSSDRKLFDPNDNAVLAYGQVTWTAAFGADGVLESVEIPFEYYDRAITVMPKYLIIVFSASKFGDYFCGGEGSVIYLDDVELIYE